MTAEHITLGFFLAGLTFCVLTGTEVLFALLFGLVCFSLYSIRRGNSPGRTCSMLLEGASRVSNILIIFVLIGCLTASWRICGAIPFILYHAVSLIQPRYFVLCTFLLCSMMSFLTGTSFGTVSTMGVICMLISNAAGLDPLLTGGAVLSGIFFGDRCSPMSSSAQLVCSLTDTDIYTNIKNMVRSGLIPFLVSCFLYVILAGQSAGEPDLTIVALFKDHFSLHWITALPALLILGLALMHVNVKYAMTVSILAAVAIALFLQNTAPAEMLRILWTGYRAETGTRLAELMNGGGIQSMVKAGLIVLISSSYSGIFSHTGLLSGIKKTMADSARFLTPFGTVTLTSLFACAVSCNQSLGTILTCQICEGLYEKKEELALALEDTSILLAALIPWGIAGAVPVATIGASMSCLFLAFYLYLVPLWGILLATFRHSRRFPSATSA
ncbi:MAG: Na+/H+ antiporter NhaC family protein [Enterocloster sp.]